MKLKLANTAIPATQPSRLCALALVDVGRLPIRHHSTKQVPRHQPAGRVSEVVRTTHDQAKDGDVDQPANQGAA